MRNVFQEKFAQVTTTGIMSVVPSPLATADVHVVHEEYKQYLCGSIKNAVILNNQMTDFFFKEIIFWSQWAT